MEIAINPQAIATSGVDASSSTSVFKTKGISEFQLSHKGLHKPEPLLPQEVAKVQKWQDARNKYLKSQREVDICGLEQNLQSLLEKAEQAIKNNVSSG